jgi:Flp pilus assembly pilin Flp
MNSLLLNLHSKLHGLQIGTEGQDMVEYALLVSLVALVCVAGIDNVAGALNTVFSSISGSLA